MVFSALVFLGFVFTLFWRLLAGDNILLRESEDAIRAELTSLVALREAIGTERFIDYLSARDDVAANGFFYSLRNTDGGHIAGTLKNWPDANKAEPSGDFLRYEIDHTAAPSARSSQFPFSSQFDILAMNHPFPDGQAILVGRDIDDLEVAQFVAETLGWVVLGILLLLLALSFGVAYYVSSRFDRIAATADRIIQTGSLSERLDIDSEWDDLSKLSALLNRMLGEIATRVDSVKSVADGIAHDLRTPLMRLRALIDESTDGTVREELLHELDLAMNVFLSLMRISSIESGKAPLPMDRVELGSVIADAIALYEPLAEEKCLDFSSETEEAFIRGDRDLVFQAIANTLDNAIKFTPSGGHIECRVKSYAGESRVSLIDSGPGIPEASHGLVFERFRRLDESRSEPGNGLGLTLVQAIMNRHRGTVSLSPAQADGRGLKVDLVFPGLLVRSEYQPAEGIPE